MIFDNRSQNSLSELCENYILMRWKGNINYSHYHWLMKEQCFVDAGASTGLTILGFYYCCLRREDGVIEGNSIDEMGIEVIGLYWDPSSAPYQRLSLNPASSKTFHRSGRRCFPVYAFR
jgi:hypothetical protein